MTANALEGDREACVAAGMHDYVTKPLTPEALAAALQRCSPADRRPSAIDREAATRLRNTLGEAWSGLMQDFRADAAAQVERMRASPEGAAEAAHTLRSTALAFGAVTLGELCGRLEATGDASLIDDIAAEVARVGKALAIVGEDAG
jgi:HPt (histidine-containing phosphotransfer) domain-containing protein